MTRSFTAPVAARTREAAQNQAAAAQSQARRVDHGEAARQHLQAAPNAS